MKFSRSFAHPHLWLFFYGESVHSFVAISKEGALKELEKWKKRKDKNGN